MIHLGIRDPEVSTGSFNADADLGLNKREGGPQEFGGKGSASKASDTHTQTTFEGIEPPPEEEKKTSKKTPAVKTPKPPKTVYRTPTELDRDWHHN